MDKVRDARYEQSKKTAKILQLRLDKIKSDEKYEAKPKHPELHERCLKKNK